MVFSLPRALHTNPLGWEQLHPRGVHGGGTPKPRRAHCSQVWRDEGSGAEVYVMFGGRNKRRVNHE